MSSLNASRAHSNWTILFKPTAFTPFFVSGPWLLAPNLC